MGWLWISLSIFLGVHMHAFLLGVYLGVELLSHRVCACSAFSRFGQIDFIVVVLIYIPIRVPIAPHPLQYLIVLMFLTLTIQVKCISSQCSLHFLEVSSYVYWTRDYFPLWSDCPNLLPVFLLDYLSFTGYLLGICRI